MIAMPSQASAQIARHRRNEKQHRTNAYALGAAGLILMGSKQNTVGTIALAGAAYEAKRMQDEIDARHRQYGSRNGSYSNRDWRTGSSRNDGYYDSNGRWHQYSSTNSRNGYYDRNGSWHSGSSSNSSGYYDSNGRWHSYNTNNSSRDGYYDSNGRWHSYSSSNSSRDGYYDRDGRWHSYNNGYDRYNSSNRRNNDDCDDDRYDRDRKGDRNGREWSSTRGNKRGWDKNGKRRHN